MSSLKNKVNTENHIYHHLAKIFLRHGITAFAYIPFKSIRRTAQTIKLLVMEYFSSKKISSRDYRYQGIRICDKMNTRFWRELTQPIRAYNEPPRAKSTGYQKSLSWRSSSRGLP